MTGEETSERDALVEFADLVQHVARKLRASLAQLPELSPLTQFECLTLHYVHNHPGVSPSDLAHDLTLRASNASTAVRGLIEKGQLQRAVDPSDRRAARLYTTAEAEQAIALVQTTWHELLAQVDLPREDTEAALRALRAIDATLAAL